MHVIVHGGGWVVGSPNTYVPGPLAQSQNVIIVAMAYRSPNFTVLDTCVFSIWDIMCACHVVVIITIVVVICHMNS